MCTFFKNNKSLLGRVILWTIVIISICILFKDFIELLVNNLIVHPFFNTWGDYNKWVTMAALVIIIIVFYILSRKRIQLEGIFSNRRLVFYYTTIVLLFFRLFGNYDYLGFDFIKFIDIVLIEIVLIELLFIIIALIKKGDKNQPTTYAVPFSIDGPTTKDDFNRRHFARTIIQKIIATDNSGEESNAFTILLSESFGVGKSSFFRLVEEEYKKYNNICCFYFKPWLSDSPELMTSNFFRLLQENMGDGNDELGKLLKTYAAIFAGKPSSNLINTIFNNTKHSSLEEQHKKIAENLHNGGKKYLILIDDVDRLQYKELVELIRMIRNTADFPNVFYLVAADKDAIMLSLRKNGNIDNPELYLQKFFNYELLLPAYEPESMDTILCLEIQSLLSNYGFSKIEQNDIVKTVIGRKYDIHDVFKTPRDVKRYMNLLSTELDALNTEIKNRNGDSAKLNDKYICIKDMLKLMLIKYLRPDVYKTLRDNNANFILNMLLPSKQLVIAADNKKFFENVFSKRNSWGKITKYEDIEYDSTSDQSQDKLKQISSFANIIDSYTPTNEYVVKDLFIELWSENRTINNDPTINKNDEFFKYFAGRFRNNEVTLYEVESYLKEPVINGSHSSPDFIRWLNNSISDDKMESIVEKAKRLRLPYEYRFDAIVNIFTCVKVYYDYANLQDKRYKLLDSYQEWTDILKSLLLKDMGETIPDKFYESFLSFISFTDNIKECALLIEQLGIYKYWEDKQQNRLIPCLFSKEQYDDYSKMIIDRAFSERVVKDPYSIETFDLHCFIKRSNPKYWIEEMSKYIRKSDNPLDWLFGVLFWDEKQNKFYWNPYLCSVIYNEMELVQSMEHVLGELLIDDYKSTLTKLASPFENRFNGMLDNDSMLFKDVKKWQLEGRNHFPNPNSFYTYDLD